MALLNDGTDKNLSAFKELPPTPRKGRAGGRKAKTDKKRADKTTLVRPTPFNFPAC